MVISRLKRITIGGVQKIVMLPTGAVTYLTKTGNFQSYSTTSSPWSAYTGMWGKYIAPSMVADSSMQINEATFPVGLRFNYDIEQNPSHAGVNGYLALSYGNYEYSPRSITPRQVSTIGEFTFNATWTLTGDTSAGLLCELWLTAEATPSGPLTHTAEIGFLPHNGPGSQTWVNNLPVVGSGSFVDKNGIIWNVREAVDGSGTVPYFVAYRPGHADFQGEMPFKDYLTFLAGAGKINTSHWINGAAFGVEPQKGSGTLVINSASVVDTLAPVNVTPAIVDDFTGADGALDWGKWTHYGGVSRVSNRARVPMVSDTAVAAMQSPSYVLNLTQSPVWIEVPSVPALPGNGTKIAQFNLDFGSNTGPRFFFFYAAGVLQLRMELSENSAGKTEIAYDPVAHRWLRIRLNAGNVLWETSPDGLTWTVRKTVAAPSYTTTALARCYISASYPGTSETTNFGYFEFDNFNIVPTVAANTVNSLVGATV